MAIAAHRKNKNPDVSATFFRLGTLSIPAKRKRTVLQLFYCIFRPRSAFFRHPTIRNRKKLHPDPIFCFWALGIALDGTVGQLQCVQQNKKPGICLACMSEDDAPPCGPQILEMQRAPLRAPSPHKQPHSPARLPFGELRSPLAFTFPLLRAPQHVRTGATLLLPQARAVTC